MKLKGLIVVALLILLSINVLGVPIGWTSDGKQIKASVESYFDSLARDDAEQAYQYRLPLSQGGAIGVAELEQ